MNISAISNNNLQQTNLNSKANANNTAPNFGKNVLSTGIAKLLETDTFGKLVEKTSKNKIDIVKHISAANGLLIGGMYVKNTLQNDKLDPHKRKTLAINQAIVSGVATVLGYTFNKAANNWIEGFTDKFRAANIKNFGEDAVAKLGHYNGAIKAATSMLIFTSIYRYVSPVVVTPIANKIGNALEAKNKKAEIHKTA